MSDPNTLNGVSLLMALLINGALVALAVMIHYEILFRISRWLPALKIRHRFRMVLGILGCLLAHVLEIWMFAAGLYFMHDTPLFGVIEGHFNGSLLDSVYLSFLAYTSLGYSAVEPVGYIRYLLGMEAMTGLVFIAWTASFLFLEMRRFWDDR